MKKEVKVHDKTFEIYISAEEIQIRVDEIGKAISAEFKGRNPLFLSILNGSFIFTADIMRACDLECEVSFVKLSSYQGTETTGKIKTLIGLDNNIAGREVIILEDIVDTGNTLTHFLEILDTYDPKSVTLVSLLTKPEVLKDRVKVDQIGFEIPNKFVVGYGLDYDGLARNLKDIYQLKAE